MTDYAAVLTKLHSDRQWILDGNDYNQLTMLDGDPKPTKKSMDDAWPSIKQELDAARAAKDVAKSSALLKLTALGLTEDEAKAIIG